MGNNFDQNPNLAGVEGQKLVDMARDKKKLAHDIILNVYHQVPPEFHKNIRLLSQREKLIDKQFNLSEELKEYGLQSYRGKTYIETFKPYFDVEGRIEQMIAVHKDHGATYTLDTYPEQINNYWVMTCVFEGLNKYGQQFKTKERAIIGFGGSGIDASNPIENASTSAVGRALSHGGYGNIGSGLSSFEDIYIAITRQKALDKLKDEKKPPKSPGKSQSGQTGASGSGIHQSGKNIDLTSQELDDRQAPERGQMSPAGNQLHNQQQFQSQPGRFNDQRNVGNRQPQDEGRQGERDLRKMKSVLVGRLITMSKDWPQTDLKSKVSGWLNINWNGRFNVLDVGQLQHVEENLKLEIQNTKAS